MKVGDAVSKIAQPIARGIDYVFGTDVEHCQGCKQRQQTLNTFGDSIYDYLFKKGNKMEEQTDYVLVVHVVATDIREALDKVASGKVLSINPRPKTASGVSARPPVVTALQGTQTQ